MEENFDDMSNDQLRLKLLEYGFTNMPVTSTTRKVLIKKLRNHISDSATKLRRETIHATKYSSDEDTEPSANSSSKKFLTKKESTNRRATIGGLSAKPSQPTLPKESKAAAVTLKSTGVASAVHSDTASKRRSGRVTPIKGNSTAVVMASAVLPLESIVMEDSDEDMIPLTQLKQRDRKSKSPSLSRTEMLTTSYLHQVEVSKSSPVEPIVEEMEIDLPELAKEQQIETIVLEDYDEMQQEAMPPPRQPPIPKSGVKESVYNKKTSQVNSPKIPSTLEPQKKDVPEPFKYRITSESRPIPAITTSSSISVSDSLRADSGPRIEPTDSPYLSEFTKRLYRLRAETVQLPSRVGARESPSRRTKLIEEKGVTHTSASTRSTYGSTDAYEASAARFRAPKRYTFASFSSEAVSPRSKSEDIRSSLRNSLQALDQKYSIMRKFCCVIIFLMVVFLFVFFFM